MSAKAFTLAFEGDIRAFEGNPLKTDTPFGRPVASGIGDAFDEIDMLTERVPTLEAEVLRLREALTEARTDLMICADNVRDAAKTDPRWEGVADKLMARVAECDKALKGETP